MMNAGRDGGQCCVAEHVSEHAALSSCRELSASQNTSRRTPESGSRGFGNRMTKRGVHRDADGFFSVVSVPAKATDLGVKLETQMRLAFDVLLARAPTTAAIHVVFISGAVFASYFS